MPPKQAPNQVGSGVPQDSPINDPSLYPAQETNEPQPIGVPFGYTVERRRPTWGVPSFARRGSDFTSTGARYVEGAELEVYAMGDQQRAMLQQSLIRAGLLDPEDVVSFGQVGPHYSGNPDPTVAAFRAVLAYANQAGYERWQDALGALATNGYGAGQNAARDAAGGAGRLPAPVSNADDLHRVFRAAVIDTLGQGWSDAQIDGMVQQYQAAERGFNAQAAAATEPGQVPAEGLPSPETFARNAATQADPTGAQAQGFLGAANQFFSLIGQWNPPSGELNEP